MYTINTIQTELDHSKREVIINNKTFYVCNVCGRLSFRKTSAHGLVWCAKHYRQQKKHGHAIDNNPRTAYDRNEIRINDKIAEMDLYDQSNNVIATTIFDAEDVEKIRYTKWKLSSSGYVMYTPKFKGGNKHFSRVILNTDQFVDHINHNILDNRKSNLRIVTKSQNAINRTNPPKGVSQMKNGLWYAYIKINRKMINLGHYSDIEEALWARWFAEKQIFKAFAYDKPEPAITDMRKSQITDYVNKKVQRL